MAELVFEDLEFAEKDGKVIVKFLDHFYFEVEKKALSKFRIRGSRLEYDGMPEQDARNRINSILDAGFENLSSSMTRKPAVYVHRYFGLPLIGSSAFGIVDRNSSMLEIKPITGCNMNCLFCSVDEGLSTRKSSELVIEAGFLVEEARRVIEFKGCDVHITINAHGEPTSYRPMPELINGLSNIPQVKTISLITNGTFLSERYIDRLVDSGLTRLNVSLNAFNAPAAKMLEGHGKYDVEHVKRMCGYAAGKVEVVLAPVFVPGYNDLELKEIVLFAKDIGAKVGIQNYLYYARGRNPANSAEMPWPEFYELLKKLEAETGVKLIMSESDFGIVKTKPLPKPFRKGQVIEAVIKCPGRYRNETIAAADGRNITITGLPYDPAKNSSKIRISLTNDKHNIFYGKAL